MIPATQLCTKRHVDTLLYDKLHAYYNTEMHSVHSSYLKIFKTINCEEALYTQYILLEFMGLWNPSLILLDNLLTIKLFLQFGSISSSRLLHYALYAMLIDMIKCCQYLRALLPDLQSYTVITCIVVQYEHAIHLQVNFILPLVGIDLKLYKSIFQSTPTLLWPIKLSIMLAYLMQAMVSKLSSARNPLSISIMLA